MWLCQWTEDMPRLCCWRAALALIVPALVQGEQPGRFYFGKVLKTFKTGVLRHISRTGTAAAGENQW